MLDEFETRFVSYFGLPQECEMFKFCHFCVTIRFPVLVVLDGVNAFDVASGYVNPATMKPIHANKLAFPNFLERFRQHGPVCHSEL